MLLHRKVGSEKLLEGEVGVSKVRSRAERLGQAGPCSRGS